MRTYTRIRLAGGWYFFTVNLAARLGSDLLVRYITDLRNAFRQARHDHPFSLDAIVILPDHLHGHGSETACWDSLRFIPTYI
jgi:putative transposase